MSEREKPSTLASDFAQFVDQLHSLDLSSGDLSHLEKASAVLQAALQAEKSRLEIEKLEVEKNNLLRGARSEQVRFWVPIVAPFISAIAVIATLLFQMHQFNENSRLTRQTDEGVQFRAAIQSAKMPTGIQAYTSQALLTSFLKSETYGSQARVVAVSMMAGIGSPEGFRSLFESVFAKASYSDLPELARLSRMQNEIVGRAFDEKKRAEENLSRIEEPGSRSPNSSMAISSAKGQINQIQADIDSLGQQAAMTTSSIAAALKLKPSGEVSDLSALWLWGSDLSTISFGKASLDRTSIQNCDITNADFSEVTNFKESNWSQTAWWRAAKLNPALAEYLKANYPFDLKESYFGRPVTKEEYDGALAHFSIKP